MRTRSTLLAVLLLAACSADPSAGTSTAPTDEDWTLVVVEGDVGDDPGMSVAAALTHGATDDIVTVSGFLFVDAAGTIAMCEAILESFPPQCGGARLPVEGLDLGTVDLEEANGVRWAEGVVLLGSVE